MKRNPGVELLRCVLMFLVVLHHCCYHGPFKSLAVGGISSTTVFAVDAFVFISGYFGIKVRPEKFFSLMLKGLVATVLVGVWGVVMGYGVDFRYGLGWFGNSYLALMALSPVINEGIDGLQRNGLLNRAMTMLAFVFFVSWGSSGFLNLKVAGWGGHTFSSMLFMYVLGRYLFVTQSLARLKRRTFALSFVGLMAINLFWSWAMHVRPDLLAGSRDYNNPIVVMLAVSVVMIFLRLPLPDLLARGSRYLAPSMFMVYLLHDGVESHFLRRTYSDVIKVFGDDGGGGMHSRFWGMHSRFLCVCHLCWAGSCSAVSCCMDTSAILESRNGYSAKDKTQADCQ